MSGRKQNGAAVVGNISNWNGILQIQKTRTSVYKGGTGQARKKRAKDKNGIQSFQYMGVDPR